MKYTKEEYPEKIWDQIQSDTSAKSLLEKIRLELRTRNQIEWIKAMIEYSDDPEKYKQMLKELWIQRE